MYTTKILNQNLFMNTLALLCAIVFYSNSIFAQTTDYIWAKSAGEGNDGNGNSVTIDGSGSCGI